MSRRLEQINKLIQRTFGEILLKEADLPTDVLVTVSRVDTTPNLRAATIWIYSTPLEQGQDVVELLQKQLYDLQGSLNKKLSLKPLPRIQLRLDEGASYAERIEKKLAELKESDSPS